MAEEVNITPLLRLCLASFPKNTIIRSFLSLPNKVKYKCICVSVKYDENPIHTTIIINYFI